MELSDISFGGTKVPWNSMECSMEFHGIFHEIPWNICVIWSGALLIPWNPMELGDFLFDSSRVPWNSIEYDLEVQPG